MVHKLNVELSKRQSNGSTDILEGDTLQGPPSWLHDLRQLAPLVLAFEEEVFTNQTDKGVFEELLEIILVTKSNDSK